MLGLKAHAVLQGFDRNNFAETEDSLKLLAKLGPDVLLVEGAAQHLEGGGRR